jgi:hypothetical protein
VKVTFKPAAHNMVGPVYGEVRMMREWVKAEPAPMKAGLTR